MQSRETERKSMPQEVRDTDKYCLTKSMDWCDLTYYFTKGNDANANGMKNSTNMAAELSAPLIQPDDGNLTTEENLAENGVKNTTMNTDMAAEPSAPVFQPDDGYLTAQENLAYQAANDFITQPNDTYQIGACDQDEVAATLNEIYVSIEEEEEYFWSRNAVTWIYKNSSCS